MLQILKNPAPKLARWEIQYRIGDKWLNCWTKENGEHETFDSQEEAAKELREYHAACRLAIEEGDFSHHCPDDYRITVSTIRG